MKTLAPDHETAELGEEGFAARHIGPSEAEQAGMLSALGLSSLDELADKALPAAIRSKRPLNLPRPLGENAALAELKALAEQNEPRRPLLGGGYYGTFTPALILRNILENPGWYTQYTPYQAEISQGRLEALLNFQTLIVELTGLPVANASLLDEATAAAEAMAMAYALRGAPEKRTFRVSSDCHPQTIAVLQTRARPLGLSVQIAGQDAPLGPEVFGVLLQYPAGHGPLRDIEPPLRRARENGALACVAADILALTLLRPPGELGADIVLGSAQRFGVPLGYGGPHAAYFATRSEYVRHMPGRIVGVSKDAEGRPALRLAIQTREQHIRREKATSNICTSQVLLAIMASMYALYHGPRGLAGIARRAHRLACLLAEGLRDLGYRLAEGPFFDTLHILAGPEALGLPLERLEAAGFDLRAFPDGSLGVSLDETCSEDDVRRLLEAFSPSGRAAPLAEFKARAASPVPEAWLRRGGFLEHPVFNRYHSETEMLRYLHRLQAKDLSLTTSMIPLGSCTMKLNASSEMLPVTWPGFASMHPLAPAGRARGYRALFEQLERWLAEITGFAAVSLQPNAGSQGEYAGLLVIRRYHESRGQGGRLVCLIPQSAHGTNPASAAMAGLKVVPVRCDDSGNIDVDDLKAKAAEHAQSLAALMVTYPSTHGVFEERIREICDAVHARGAQVYMDGANLNAQVGLCRPAEIGADVCHMNLHKTFCIPHGGGGPGMGPIGVAAHLACFLPSHPLAPGLSEKGIGPISAAPWGSAGILPIPWMYIRMMGAAGLKKATQTALLNANYVAARLAPHYPVLYRGPGGFVAHECILDLRPLKASSGVSVEDVAKRLMDYGFHAPTVSFPVAGTLMVEPTESESKAELERFCEAMISIRGEIAEIEAGRMSREDNPLKNAPHTASRIAADWRAPYSRERAVFPAPWTREHKYWPPVSRVDNPYGDRNLVCSCSPDA